MHRTISWTLVSSLIALAIACSEADDPSPSPDGGSGNGGSSGGSSDASGTENPGPSSGGSSGSGGTSSGSPDASGTPGSASPGCQAFAKSFCDWLPRCSPDVFLFLNVEEADCEARYEAFCSRLEGAPGAGSMPASCASDLDALTCTGNIEHLPASCWVKGTLENGAACELGAQCQSGWCNLTVQDFRIGPCGTCDTPAKENESCLEVDCDHGLLCTGLDLTCKRPAGKDEPCSGGHGCEAPYQCFENVCIEPLGEDAPCELRLGGIQACDETKGLFCVAPDGQNGTCKRVKTADLGDPCGDYVDEDEHVYCSQGACSPVTETCTALAEDGAACHALQGPYCQLPAECLEGRCVIPDAARCE